MLPSEVMITIPYNDRPEWLELAADLWLAQEGEPSLLVIDNRGRLPRERELYRKLRQHPRVEVAVLNLPGHYPHSSDPVAISTDYAFSRCETPYLLTTHSDVFPRHRGVVQFMQQQCSAEQPVVGWEMSLRGEHAEAEAAIRSGTPGATYPTGPSVSDGNIGHVCSIFHVPTMDRIGLKWSLRVGSALFGLPREQAGCGWPDTESCGSSILRMHNVPMKFLGRETNFETQVTEHWIHARTAIYVIEQRHWAAFQDAAMLHAEWGLTPRLLSQCSPIGSISEDYQDVGPCARVAYLQDG